MTADLSLALQPLVFNLVLVVLLWSLQARLRGQEFLRDWVKAGTASAVCLAAGALSSSLPWQQPALQAALDMVAILAAFTQVALLVSGAFRLGRPGAAGRAWRPGLAPAVLACLLSVVLATAARESSAAAAVLRRAPVMLALACAMAFCALALFGRLRMSRSLAAAVTAAFFLASAADHALRAASLVARGAAGSVPDAALTPPLAHPLHLALWSGIWLGLALLLVEEHRRSEQEALDSVTRERREVRARHDAILEAIPDWMFLMSRDGVYLDFHGRDRRDLFAPPEQFIGKSFREIMPPTLAGGLARLFAEALETGGPCHLDYAVPIRDSMRHYEARVVRCDGDKLLSVVRDVTDWKRSEGEVHMLRDELAHAGRVTVLGALAGSLAHEMNQPLAALMANGQAALRMIGRPRPQLDELRATLDDMVSDSRRAGDVIRQLRSFARKEPPAQAPIDVNETAREVVRLLEGDAQGRRIWLEVHLDPELPSVVGDRVQLQQVMLNLLMNAFDAVESREVGGRRVILRSQRESDRVTLSVADHGAGVSDEHLSRLFEPFFTTKPEGMGLGLSISSAIVSEHGGVLRSERNPERGMTFSFSLPLPPGRELSAAERQVAAGRMR